MIELPSQEIEEGADRVNVVPHRCKRYHRYVRIHPVNGTRTGHKLGEGEPREGLVALGKLLFLPEHVETHMRVDARQQLFLVEGLRHVVVTLAFQSVHNVFLGAFCAYHYNRDVRRIRLTKLLAHLIAGHMRHHDIE